MQQDESDRSGGVCEKSTARFLSGDSGIGLPSPLQRGEEAGAHRRLPVLREEDRFPQLAGKVRKTEMHTQMYIYLFIRSYAQAMNMKLFLFCFWPQKSQNAQLVGIQQHEEESAVQGDLSADFSLRRTILSEQQKGSQRTQR